MQQDLTIFKGFFCQLKKPSNKYRESSKKNKNNKMKDLEREKANKGPEKSANVAKLQK